MNKRIIATRFGLVALMLLSLFASTTFAGNAPAPTQVVVTNTLAQPVQMVGLTKDSDAPARKPFQWNGTFNQDAGTASSFTVTTVPANQRLVIEQVSSFCQGGMLGAIGVEEYQSGVVDHWQWLAANFADGNNVPASASIRFYVGPGADFKFSISNWSNVFEDLQHDRERLFRQPSVKTSLTPLRKFLPRDFPTAGPKGPASLFCSAGA